MQENSSKKTNQRQQKPPNEQEYSNEDCLSPKMCKGKHKKYAPKEEFVKNAEQLFKNQDVRIVNTEVECRAIVDELRRHLEEYNVLGFDCEWISQYRRYPVALLQLSTHRGLCALIRLCKIKKIPDELQQLLEDESILKVGIQPHADARYLVQDYGITRVASILDLRALARECDCKASGLGALAEQILNVILEKNRCVCASNWEAATLTELQIDYAAKDARVGIEIFKVFQEKIKPKPIDTDPKQHLQEFIDEVCTKYLNSKRFSNKEPKKFDDYFENQKICYVNTADEYLTAIAELKTHCDEYNVVGFKILKTINGSEVVPLLQLASHRRLSVIVPLNGVYEEIPVEIQELLEDKNILKVGFNPKLDIPTEINAAGTLDLNFVRPKENFPCFGLTKLARRHLNVKLRADASPKLQRVKENLERNEAHISIELFKEFTKKRRPKVDESNSKESLQRHIEKACSKYLDKKFDIRNEMFRKPKKSKKSKQSKKADNSGPTPEKSPRTEQASNKADK